MLGQDYPGQLEVLVVDGGSQDDTVAVVERYGARDGRVRLLENPAGTIPAGLNVGIRAAQGDIVARVDARTRLATDYIGTAVDGVTGLGNTFGVGLVKTSGDFGSQGQPPSHPELLDWIAVSFRETGWDVKKLVKLIVTSAAYRQSAAITPEKLKKDPKNVLLTRGPRVRLDGEVLRDSVLAASGLLVRKFGGPPVKPYQPAGLWEEIATDTLYEQSTGADLYRRSLYTYWKRTVANPTLTLFDAPTREELSRTVRRVVDKLLHAPTDAGQDARHVDMIWPLWNLLDFTPEPTVLEAPPWTPEPAPSP